MTKSITPAMMRSLQAVHDHKPLRGTMKLSWRHAIDLGLGSSEIAPELTATGELVVMAYRLGRSRWGAHG